MIRFPQGFEKPLRLPSSFGGDAYRGTLTGEPVLLLALDFEPDAPEPYGARAQTWESLALGSGALAKPVRWFLEGSVFFLAFHDPGGVLVSDLLADPRGWEKVDDALLPFLDQWGKLADQGATLVLIDPSRLVLGPQGLVSFDLVHLLDKTGKMVCGPSFAAPDDILVLSPEMTSRTSLTVDLRSGLFSLGTLAYRFLAGHWPVRKTDPIERLHALLNQTPEFSGPGWASRGPVITSIVQKLLQKDPKDRYQTLRGLKWDLGQRGRSEGNSFVAGLLDRPWAITEASRLYGRSAELAQWDTSLAHLMAGGAVSLVLRGVGGQGKSSLVEEFRRRTEPAGAHWVQGKFDQFEPQFSSGGVAQILDQWVNAPWGLEAGLHQGSIEGLQELLGRNQRILTTVIPALVPYWGDPEPVQNPEESQQKLLQTLVLFFGWLAASRPIVIAVEDFHWADPLSVKILEALVRARIPRLGILGTCRPEGEERYAELLSEVGRVGPGGGVRNLGPLDEEAVLGLLEEGSALEREDRQTLAKLLVRYGSGNPFSIRILIREINLRQAVVFDGTTGRWSLRTDLLRDLPQGEALTLVVQRMGSLAPEVRRALLVASIMGVQFSQEEVSAAGGMAPKELDGITEELFDLGIWERLGPGEYRFGHDKIQRAAYEISTEEERHDAHLRVGRERLNRRREGQNASAGSIAVHLNRCLTELSEGEKDELVELNFQAGTGARLAHDFSGSFRFFQAAVDLAGSGLWQLAPERAWALYKAASEAAYTEFRRDLADAWCDEAVRRAESAVHRAQIRERQQSFLFFQGDIEGSIQAGIRGLKELGVSIPTRPSFLSVLGALVEVKAALVGRSMESLARQAENTNERSRVLLLLLSGFTPPAFHSGRQNLFAWAVLKATRLTLRDGVSPESAPSYTGYAVLLAALGDLRGSRRFGQLALEINRRYGDLGWRSMVLVLTSLFCTGWFEPWSRLRPLYEEAQVASEASGDVLYVTYAQLFSSLWNPGEDLPKKRQRTENALAQILKNRFPLTRVSAYFVLGRIGNLEGTAVEPFSFAAEGFDPDEGLAEYRQAQSHSGLAVCYIDMASTAFLLGDLDRAQAALIEALAFRSALAGSLYEEELTLYAGLVAADLTRRGGPGARLGRWERQARRWAQLSPTFAFHAQLLRGERLDLGNQAWSAQKAFVAAIEAADLSGILVYQALARERAFRFFERRGNPGLSRHFLAESLDRWKHYGAWAKVRSLELEAPEAGVGFLRPGDSRRSGDQPWDVDRTSLIRALEAISGEIRLDSLSRTITKLLLENSGADRVALLVSSPPGLILEGWATEAGYFPGEQQPLSGRTDLPQSLLRQAFHEKRILVLEVLTDQNFQADPILASRGVKSVIILPLSTSDRFQGLVYLENSVMPGILTLSRVRILELLSSTIGMTIQNAQLFQQVQQANEGLELRVEERTRELGASQRRILLQEKMASLGALAAGIAHELKNPINVINNFAESSMELIEELKTEFESIRGALPEPVVQNLDYLVPELVQNMVDIKRHGNRGNEIIRTMLMHTRSDSGAATLEDLNLLVQESLSLSYHGGKATRSELDCSMEMDLDPRLPLVLMVRANLGRVFINLFNNAFQAIEDKRRRVPGGYRPTVAVSTRWLDPGVRITVEDNGSGIAPEVLEKVFQPFFTTKSPGEGTGLGLSISHEIVHGDFGGSLEVMSEVDRFTRFTILLPRAGKSH